MKIYCLTLFLLLFIFQNTIAQDENNNWFLNGSLLIDFNNTPPTIDTLDSAETNEGYNVTVSDSDGNLLFFTGERQLFDKNLMLMPNGNGLGNNFFDATFSAIQPVAVVPVPDASQKYYLFVMRDGNIVFNASATGFEFSPGTLNYSIVDMNLNGGNGDIVPTQKNIFVQDNLAGSMATTQGTCGAIWLIVHEHNTNRFFSFKIDSEGIATPVVSATGMTVGTSVVNSPEYNFNHLLVVSPNSNQIAAFQPNFPQLFDFDKETGIVSNPIDIPIESEYVRTATFSPNGKYLYSIEPKLDLNPNTEDTTQFIRFDVENATPSSIQNSKTIIGELPRHSYYHYLQRAPDGHIYGSIGRILYAIKNPDDLANNVVITDSLNMAETINFTFNFPNLVVTPTPPVEQSAALLANDTLICQTADFPITLSSTITGDSYLWQNEGNDSIYVAEDPAAYWLELQTGNCLFRDTIFVDLFEETIQLPNDTTVCQEDGLLLSVDSTSFDEIIWQNDIVASKFLIEESGNYMVTGIKGNCQTTDDINVEFKQCSGCELQIPNAFTPNGDANNDIFRPIIIAECQNSLEIEAITIWSRWGTEVFASNNLATGWDGTFNGKHVAADVYFYQILAKDGAGQQFVYQGDVALIR